MEVIATTLQNLTQGENSEKPQYEDGKDDRKVKVDIKKEPELEKSTPQFDP